MKNEDFEAVNDKLEAEGKKRFANPSCAAGTLRQLDPQVVRRESFSFCI